MSSDELLPGVEEVFRDVLDNESLLQEMKSRGDLLTAKFAAK